MLVISIASFATAVVWFLILLLALVALHATPKRKPAPRFKRRAD
jgi:hypothetical protein